MFRIKNEHNDEKRTFSMIDHVLRCSFKSGRMDQMLPWYTSNFFKGFDLSGLYINN